MLVAILSLISAIIPLILFSAKRKAMRKTPKEKHSEDIQAFNEHLVAVDANLISSDFERMRSIYNQQTKGDRIVK